MTKDREKDIRFHDKTDYDIKLALNVSDYHAFVKDMAQLASVAIKKIKDNDNLKKEFEKIVNREQRTLTREKKLRHFYDLVSKRFDIIDVLKIQRKDDEHTISDKIYDFSSETVSNLIISGIRDALTQVISEFSKDIENKKGTFKNLDDPIRAEFSALLKEIKKDLTMQSYNHFNLISPELISRFHKKIDKYHDRLSAKQQYDTLSKSIEAIELSLDYTV